jgi:hypothetical protein
MVLSGKLHIVQVDGRAQATTRSERDVYRLGGIGMHSPLVEPVLNGKEVGLEFLGDSGRQADMNQKFYHHICKIMMIILPPYS